MEARIERRRDLHLHQGRRAAGVQHGRLEGSVEGRRDLERGELREVAGEEIDLVGRVGLVRQVGTQPALPARESAYFDSGVGLIWNFASWLVAPFPPSPWNGARVESEV